MNLRSLMTGPWATYIEVVVVAGLMAGSAYTGYALRDRDFQKHLRDDQTQLARIEADTRRIDNAATAISTQVRDAKDAKQAQARSTTAGLLARVPVYVPQQPPGDPASVGSDITVGFGRLHDYAALGIDPPVSAPTSEPLGAPSGIGMPAVADTIIRNYGLFHSCQAEVEAWRGWYVTQEKAWPKGDRK